MLNIRKLKIDIKTNHEKKFGFYAKFDTNKLNLIKGSNHSGKTTIVSALFYSLGMEELLGGKNTKALDSILTTEVPLDDLYYQVNESIVYVELENHNKQIITLKRYIKHVDIDPRASYIYETSLNHIDSIEPLMTYIHDGGSAKNELGFFKYLENYIGYNLPQVPTYDDSEVKLYLQVIFNSFFIEQTRGWTDFFANIPNYRTRDPKKRIVEFLLNLDATQLEKDKFYYDVEKAKIETEWLVHINNATQISNNIGASLKLKYKEPVSYDKFKNDEIDLLFTDIDGNTEDISSNISKMQEELSKLNAELEAPKDNNEEKVISLRKKVKKSFNRISKLKDIITIKEKQLKNTQDEITRLEVEITNLLDLLKVQKFFNDDTIASDLAKGICPTCKRKSEDSFYPKIKVMSLEENKSYLEQQKSILKTFEKALTFEIAEQHLILRQLEEEYNEQKSIIKYLAKDMTYNTHMTLYKEILNLEEKIKKYINSYSNIRQIFNELKILAKNYQNNETNKVVYNLSPNDFEKITSLEKWSKHLLNEFGYGSKSDEKISISKNANFELYLPTVIVDKQVQKIRTNSSASDFVRSLWSYYISLYIVSKKYNGNHIGMFIFDEPAQHAMNESDQKRLLEVLSNLNGCQSLIFSSFEDKDNSPAGKEKFENMIADIDQDKINIIEIVEHSINEK
jgi:hypothetical protein